MPLLARSSLVALACMLAAATAGCRQAPATTETRPLRPAVLPELSGVDRDAERQIRDTYAVLVAKTNDGNASAADLSAAYGALGKVLMAAEYNDAAEPLFVNAVTLAPDDPQWQYFLGHVYKRLGHLEQAAAAFERTVALQPTNVAALWWLGTVDIDLGRPADAEIQFSRALALQPGALSAVYGLGRAALARGDYAQAVEYFERVLAMNERAVAAHYPLGLAYRGLGQVERAEAHLAQRSHLEILPIDPLMTELDGLLHSVTAYQDRGMRAARSGNWQEAARQFRQAVDLAPDDPGARIDLATALYESGDVAAALVQAREAVRLAPNDRRALSLLQEVSGAAR